MGDRLLPALPIELEERILSLLPANEIACTVRLLNKAAAEHYRGPDHTVVRLVQPVPHHAFRHRCEANSRAWLKTLSYKRRLQLLCLTAAIGDLANLEVALSAAGCVLRGEVMKAAAAAGHLHVCRWLRQGGCPWDGGRHGSTLSSAAGAGHREVCEWLLASGCPGIRIAVYTAARGGHLGLAEWLRQHHPLVEMPRDNQDFLAAVAHGCCDLPALQRYYTEWRSMHQQAQQQLQGADDPLQQILQQQVQQLLVQQLEQQELQQVVVSRACGSPSPDWRDKVLWLEGQGQGLLRKTTGACAAAARRQDAVDRLRWLRQRGYPLGWDAVEGAAEQGNTAALEYLLGEAGVRVQESEPAVQAARGGHLAALRVLHAHGCPCASAVSLYEAAREAHLPVVSWLVDTFGLTVADLQEQVAEPAALSGSMEMVNWLAERGCDLSRVARILILNEAAYGGCEAMLERLVELGCPWPDDGQPYLEAARNGDLATLRRLRRLGCPWGPDGHVISEALSLYGACPLLPTLRCLVELGCPVNWGAALEKARQWGVPAEVMAWLEEGLQRSQGGG